MAARIAGTVRSPIGVKGGALKHWHAVDLLSHSLVSLTSKLGLEPSSIDAVLSICGTATGEQALNVGRNALEASGWPTSIPATAMEGGAATAFAALQYAQVLVESGGADVVIVAGVEQASKVPPGASIAPGFGKPFGPTVHSRLADLGGVSTPGEIATRLAQDYGISRADLDDWTLASRSRVGEFPGWIAPMANRPTGKASNEIKSDELADQSLDPGSFKPLFDDDGLLTAANSARPCDGSAALLVVSERFARRHQLVAPVEIVAIGLSGLGLGEASCGSQTLLSLVKDRGLAISDLGALVVHEDTAVTPLAVGRDLGVTADRTNPWGGALATGEARGASGVVVLGQLAEGLVSSGISIGAALAAGSVGAVGASVFTQGS